MKMQRYNFFLLYHIFFLLLQSKMAVWRRILYRSILFCLSLLPYVAVCQNAVTKSGTKIFPADRIAATLPTPSKEPLYFSDPSAGTFLAVIPSQFMEPMKPFLRWKQQQGFHVETLCSDNLSPDDIRSRLRSRYEAASPALPAQKYVLLVGDVEHLRAFSGKNTPAGLNSHQTDLYYGEYTGDYLPEAMVGRLSVQDSSELAIVVDKIVAYEQGRWAKPASQALLVAGSESRTPAPVTTNGQVNYLASLIAQSQPQLDTVCFRNPASLERLDSILAALGRSNALVSYTAHCTQQGWNNPVVTFATLDTLATDTPTVFVNNCCLSNAFNGTCFGEDLLRRPLGGAASVIGASNETLWAEDYYWSVGAQYPLSEHPPYMADRNGAFGNYLADPDPDKSLGTMLKAGCEAVVLAGSPYDAFYYEIYNILGDPSLSPLLGTAGAVAIALPDSVEAGCSSLAVQVSPALPNMRVTATQQDALLGTALIDENGTARLHLSPVPQADSITITAFLPGPIAAYTSLSRPVVRPAQGSLAATAYSLRHDTLLLSLRNLGSDTARGHHLLVCQDSNERLGGCLLGDTLRAALPPIAPGDTLALPLPLLGSLMGQQPFLAAHLLFSHSETYRSQHIAFPVPDLRAQLVALRWLSRDTLPVTELLPAHDYLLSATLAHPADSLCASFAQPPQFLRASGSDSAYLIPFHIEADTQHLRWDLAAYSGTWEGRYGGWIIPFRTTERFETGDFSSYPWQDGNLYPWIIDSANAHSGRYSARPAHIDHGQRSTLAIELDVLADDSISFYHKTSCEAHDWLYFFVDGRRTGYWSGSNTWRRYARALAPGHHLLEWRYQKDASVSEHDDCVYIDDITLPLSTWQQAYGTIEPDTATAAIRKDCDPRLRIYPNPAHDRVTIELPTADGGSLELYDNLGRCVDKIKIARGGSFTQYSTQHLRYGIFTLLLRTPAGTCVQKLIVTR